MHACVLALCDDILPVSCVRERVWCACQDPSFVISIRIWCVIMSCQDVRFPDALLCLVVLCADIVPVLVR